MISAGVVHDRISAVRTWHNCPSVVGWYAHRQNEDSGTARRPGLDKIFSAVRITASAEVFTSFAAAIATATGLVSYPQEGIPHNRAA
jgi:hypothetical protein